MSDIEVNGNEYRVGKLPPFKQLHVARRLAPVLAALGSAALMSTNDEVAAEPAEAEQEQTAADDKAGALMMKIFRPIAQALAQMNDADTEYVLNTCLAVVSRKQGNQWAKVLIANNRIMFEDIELPTMMQLTVAVIRENLGNFFPEPPAAASPAVPAA